MHLLTAELYSGTGSSKERKKEKEKKEGQQKEKEVIVIDTMGAPEGCGSAEEAGLSYRLWVVNCKLSCVLCPFFKIYKMKNLVGIS